MTRINLVPPETLCDQHLLAEHREITRIPSCLFKGKLKYDYPDRSATYILGPGHVKFFTNKLEWLFKRHLAVNAECMRRGFNVTYRVWKQPLLEKGFLFEDWNPTEEDIALSKQRIQAKLPKAARYSL